MDLLSRYLERYGRADEFNLDMELRAVEPGKRAESERERLDVMAAAHRMQAATLTAKRLALLPAPDNAQAYPPDGEDRW